MLLDAQQVLDSVANSTASMITGTSALSAIALAATATASIVSGRDALPFVNHFIGTNNGSRFSRL